MTQYVDNEVVEQVLTENIVRADQTVTNTTVNGILTLLATSDTYQVLSGSASGFTVVLSDARTLQPGWLYEIYNSTTQKVSVVKKDLAAYKTLLPGKLAHYRLVDNSTLAGVWLDITSDIWAKDVSFDPTITSINTSTNAQDAIDFNANIFKSVLREPTGIQNKNLDTNITFTDADRTFSIAPKSTSFNYYIRGKLYTVTSTQIYQITDTEGVWYFYFDASGGLQGSQTVWDITDPLAPCGSGYWDSTNKKWLRKNEERHGTVMDCDVHKLLHACEGPRVDSYSNPTSLDVTNYIINGDGSLNSHAQYGVNDGYYYDEDLVLNIKNATTPTNLYEQVLYPTAQVPVFYLSGTNWRKKTASTYPFYENSPNTAYYNMSTSGSWSLQPCTNDYYFATWHIISNDIQEPVAVILGQRQDSNLISAVNNNTRSGLVIPRKLSDEFYFYKKLIWQTNTTYTNTPKVRLRYIATSLEINPANDRYAVIGSYNGNATAGRYLEWYPGQSSNTSPFPIPEVSYIRTIVVASTALNTGSIGFYLSTNLVTPIVTVSVSNSVYTKVDISQLLNADDKISVKVASGTFNKPQITMYIQTSL